MSDKKNCYNCKHFERGSNSTSPSEDIWSEGNYCSKLQDEVEESINHPLYLNRYKRCFEALLTPSTKENKQ